MAKIHTLKISNYRGVEKFDQTFGMSNFICIIGRGDSGKSTILQSISAVLSPNWNYSFYDTDFHNGNIEEPIEIEVSLYDLPPALLSEAKFGFHKRLLNKSGQIIDDLSSEDSEDNTDILTIKLQVNKDLEPKWYIVNNRANQECIEISASDRAKFNVYLISDYLDKHFSWSKGNPLYSMLKQDVSDQEKSNIIIDALREAKEKVDKSSFDHLNKVIKKVEETASSLGLNISNTTTTIDFKDISVKEDKVCLHENNVPFRQKGKGSKRLVSIAIQLGLIEASSILLIDEIEQGLEPDRTRFLVTQLKKQKHGQIFITTHSSNVLVELDADNIFLMKNGASNLVNFDSKFQGCLRNNPEAFFSRKILVCEGATEVGICRTLNNYRISHGKENFAIMGIGIVDGTGSNLVEYSKSFKKVGFETCIFCDSDDASTNSKKEELKTLDIEVVDCENGNSIEQQLFNDLNWNKVQELTSYAIEEKGIDSIEKSVKNNNHNTLPENWQVNDDKNIRLVLGKSAKEKGWFKRIDHGEFIGKIWFDSLSELRGAKLESQFNNLTKWLDND